MAQRERGQKLGALPALRKEFRRETGQEFHIYETINFVEIFPRSSGSLLLRPWKKSKESKLKKFSHHPFLSTRIQHLHRLL